MARYYRRATRATYQFIAHVIDEPRVLTDTRRDTAQTSVLNFFLLSSVSFANAVWFSGISGERESDNLRVRYRVFSKPEGWQNQRIRNVTHAMLFRVALRRCNFPSI